MMDSNSGTTGFSFKFSKTAQPSKVDKAKIQNDDDKKSHEPDFIKSVEDREILSSKPKEAEKELIIPLINRNNWRLPKAKPTVTNHDGEGKPMSLDELAAREVIEDSRRLNDDLENPPNKNDTLVVPLLMQNQVPEGFETDDKLDVSLRPDSSNLDDYESVPIEHFGIAALKGMGWKPGEGIGRKNKKCVAPVEVIVRPRGLGLGANLKDLDLLKAKAANQEEFPLVVGGCVCVVEGNNKGKYGEIQLLDDETGRVVVKISDDDKLLTLPEIFLKGVSKKELKKQAKTLNKDSYEEYANQNIPSDNSRSSSREKSSKKRKHKGRSRSRSPSSEKSKRHHDEHKKKKKKNKDRHKERSESPQVSKLWIHPQLRMRIIDQKYKKGKYYNTKVIIEDVVTPTSCVCRTEEGRLLEDVEVGMLETVIPKMESGHVMILHGNFKGKVASILSRDKAKCMATMYVLPDNRNIIKLSYDSICEFVGDVSIYE